MNLLREAIDFATKAHEGQKRKYTGAPYIDHPRAVAELLYGAAADAAMVAAAWLHDVVEDCGVTPQEVEEKFGSDVATLVVWLTDVSKPSDGNRSVRKAIDRDHIAQAPARAKTIKLADLIDNSLSIEQHDPEFAKVYMREKRELLGVLSDGHPRLFAVAESIVTTYFKKHPEAI